MYTPPGGGRFLEEVEYLALSESNVYTRPDLYGLDQFLKTAKPIPSGSRTPLTTTPEQEVPDAAKFAVIHDLRTGSATSFGPSLASIANFTARETLPQATLLFLRGFASPEWLTAIGNKHGVSPELYARHMQYKAFISGARDLHASPSLPSSSARVFQLRLPTICFRDNGSTSHGPQDLRQARRVESDCMNKYLLQLRSKAKVADSVVRECYLLSEQERVLEQIISIEVKPSGNSWRAIAWLDSGLDLSQSMMGVEKPWDPPSGTLPWQIRFFPVIMHQSRGPSPQNHDPASGPTDAAPGFVPTGRLSNASMVGWKASQNVCLLPFHYGSYLDRDLASRDALYALSELFQFAAAAEVQFVNFFHHRIGSELSLLTHEGEPGDHAVSLVNLRYIEAILKRHAQSIAETVAILENRDSLDWPHEDSSATVKHTTALLLTDFKYLLERTETLVRECEEGMAALVNKAALDESRRSVDMGLRVEKLTVIATIFIPLSFLCAVWGMNFKELGSGSQPIWWFPATAGPLIVFSLAIYYFDYLSQIIHKISELPSKKKQREQ